ncbi:hypothetical protein PMSD_22980 [Paenibacillus macquariensis subsp. defensor]|nr:hypothetical protein PMSD_22980 [Paenibacillus macquariensis subsp. defensor]
MRIKYILNSERSISSQQLKDLYNNVGWWPERSLEDIKHILVQGIALGVWNENKLIGFCRVF